MDKDYNFNMDIFNALKSDTSVWYRANENDKWVEKHPFFISPTMMYFGQWALEKPKEKVIKRRECFVSLDSLNKINNRYRLYTWIGEESSILTEKITIEYEVWE